jgi:hypothetical protein
MIARWKTQVDNMGTYQQLINTIINNFNEEGGSTIKPHKQCTTLVFNRHINADQVQVELVKVNLGTIVNSVKTELPPMVVSEILLKAHHVHCTIQLIRDPKNKRFKGCTHILCASLKDTIHLNKKKGEITFDGINLCKVDVVNKKRTNAPPEEQPVPHTQN